MGLCKDGDHVYQIASKDYFKSVGSHNSIGPVMDQSVCYCTLFCSKCGDTKEIVSRDYRKVEAGK